MTIPAYFVADSGSYLPTERARGWWRHDSLQGRAITALIGRELGRNHGDLDRIPARMTLDMHGMAPFEPVTIATRVLREGRRLRLAEAVLTIHGTEFARATCQFLARGEPSIHEPEQIPGWNAPPPEALPPATIHPRALAEMRMIVGDFGSGLPRQAWLLEQQVIVAGEEPSAWERLAAVADFASPWAHTGGKIGYINTDVTTQIHRLPIGEWIGFEVTGHEASQGIAVGHCRVHDIAGAFGHVSTTAVAMRRQK